VIGSSGDSPTRVGVTTDRDNILALYFNEGFPEASFSYTAERAATSSASSAGGSNGTLQRPGQKDSKPAFRTSRKRCGGDRVQEGPQTAGAGGIS